MKTWHAVAFLIVTARGRAVEPVSESFAGFGEGGTAPEIPLEGGY
jgi:hypothetical protein